MGVRSIKLKRRKPEGLQYICISVIVKKFDQVLSKPGSERGLEFLQRIWSDELLRRLQRSSGVSLDHIALFINPYLKELSLDNYSQCIPALITKLEIIESNLTVFTAINLPEDVLWHLLCLLPITLERLDLQSDCTDDMLIVVAEKFPHLKKLGLDECEQISDSGIQALCLKDKDGNILPNDMLQSLGLLYTSVTKEGLTFILMNFPNLVELIHNDLLETIFEMHRDPSSLSSKGITYNLKRLVFCGGSSYPPAFKVFSTVCPYVMDLDITLDSQAEIDALVGFTSLKNLAIRLGAPCDLMPLLKVRGKTLKKLAVVSIVAAKFMFSLEAMATFCPKVECLFLSGPEFEEVKSFSSGNLKCAFRELKLLRIHFASHVNLEEAVILILSQSPNLEDFRFWNERMFQSVSFVNLLVRCNCLSKLNVLDMYEVDINMVELHEATHNFTESILQ